MILQLSLLNKPIGLLFLVLFECPSPLYEKLITENVEYIEKINILSFSREREMKSNGAGDASPSDSNLEEGGGGSLKEDSTNDQDIEAPVTEKQQKKKATGFFAYIAGSDLI